MNLDTYRTIESGPSTVYDIVSATSYFGIPIQNEFLLKGIYLNFWEYKPNRLYYAEYDIPETNLSSPTTFENVIGVGGMPIFGSDELLYRVVVRDSNTYYTISPDSITIAGDNDLIIFESALENADKILFLALDTSQSAPSGFLPGAPNIKILTRNSTGVPTQLTPNSSLSTVGTQIGINHGIPIAYSLALG